jgi:regulator of protease activity HflC (stomatin/prohibitin superfamily)
MRKTVPEGYIGLFWKRGKILRELPAGSYRHSALLGQKIQLVDVRSAQLATMPEEFATKDNLNVRCVLTVTYHVTGPSTLVRTTADALSFMRTQMADALRSEISQLTLDELLPKVSEIHAAAEQTLKQAFEKAGISLDTLSPLNLLIPRSLRQAFEAEVTARKRAVADLEEARGRTAVLRHLSNAAAQVEQQPALLQLLMGQKAKHVQFQFIADEKPGKPAKK